MLNVVKGDYNHFAYYCTARNSWDKPLIDNASNCINPCFFSTVYSALLLFSSVFMICEGIQQTWFNYYGEHRIKYSFGSIFKLRSVGIINLIKYNSIFIQCILSLALLSFNFISLQDIKSKALMIQSAVLILCVLPLHLIETTRSLVASTSLLLFWLMYCFFFIVGLAQDIFSMHKIFIPDTENSIQAAVFVVEVMLCVNAIGILLLESCFYHSSIELVDYYNLNDWDISSIRNIFSRIMFTYVNKTIRKSRENDEIELDDLPSYNIDVDNKVAYTNFLHYWAQSKSTWQSNKEKLLAKSKLDGSPLKASTPSLFIPLFKLTFPYVLRNFFFEILEFASEISQPYLLKYFLLFATNRYNAHISNHDQSAKETEPQPAIVGIAIASCVLGFTLLETVSESRQTFNSQLSGQTIFSALSSHIYYKGMKLSPKARKNKTVGEIVNNLAQDISIIDGSPQVVIKCVLEPIKFAFYMYTVYNFMGIAAIFGFFSSLILVPIAGIGIVFIFKYIKLLMKFRDQRSKLTNEILTSIKSIKLYSWEEKMLERLLEIRNDKELATVKKVGLIATSLMSLWSSIPRMIAIGTFLSATLIGKVTLTPDVVFPSLTVFGLLTRPIVVFPFILQTITTTSVSLGRLSSLFVMEELEIKKLQRKFEPIRKGEQSVVIENATFVWTKESEEEKVAQEQTLANSNRDEENGIESGNSDINPVALMDINFTAKKGELSCVVGRVGSGKSTLLKAILGCIPVDDEISKPSLKVNGTIAYCAQNAWILNSTVRENILFGRRYNKAFYEATIEACELTKDLDILPDGDNTVVGEKGISLSGGQKARLSLARAVYSKADIYVLDDILSAVDTHVGKSIIKRVLSKKGLLRNKTIILATNSVPVLHEADSIVLLEQGKITERGTFDQVMSSDSHLAKLIKEFGKKNDGGNEDIQGSADDQLDSKSSPPVEISQNSGSSEESEADIELTKVDSNSSKAPSFVSFNHTYEFQDEPENVRKTGNTEEIQRRGRIGLGVYKPYLKACGYFNICIYIVCLLSSTLFSLANNYVLKYWSEENAQYGFNVRTGFFLTLYGSVALIGVISMTLSSIFLVCVVAIKGSQFFHDSMAKSVLRCPMSFFDTTPIGRILNRFNEDIGDVDRGIVEMASSFIMLVARAFVIFAIVILNLPFMIVVIILLIFMYDNFRRSYISSSRELKRMISANRSPIYSHAQESLNGVDTIYAFKQDDRFKFRNSKNLNNYVKVHQASLAVDCWLSMRLQGLSAIVVYCSYMMVIVSLTKKNPMGPGLIGFIMTYILDVTSSLIAIVRMFADLENRAVTIERLLEFINLKPEAQMIVDENRPDPSWPQHGAISFVNYETRYRENLDPVLSNINIDIKPTEKIGIVGRTGAGKSTLSLALFRIIEASQGHIEIDGVDTSKLGLSDLRSKLNIIPQDSQTIMGTIRENLDPLKRHNDEQLWKVLELAHLKEHIANMKTEDKPEDQTDDDANKIISTGLDAKVEEGGGNLSTGQKQLLCLARSLLNESRVLVLDEATASVDVQTDKVVQDTIRSEFKDKTILTIAHRIDTIMDSDRVLVLDKGMVKEFDSPQNLLADKTSAFYFLYTEGHNT